MPSGLKSTPPRIVIGVLSAILLTIIAAPTSNAQIPDLIITVGDTIGDPGNKNSVITVFLDNIFDTVAAFELWIRIGNPEILEFQTDEITVVDTTYWLCGEWNGSNCNTWIAMDDSVSFWQCNQWSGEDCIDSILVPADSAWDMKYTADSVRIQVSDVLIGSFDTAGSLISGWEFVTSRSVFGNGQDIKITAVADRFTVPGTVPGIAPQQGGVLFRLLGDILCLPDTATLRTSPIIPDPFLEHFSFPRPDGSSIGLSDSLRPDTNYWRCESWVPPDSTTCLQWTKVSGPPWDSVAVELDTVTFLDPDKVWLISGSLTMLPGSCGTCGQLDNDPEGVIDLGDLTFLIAYLFLQGAVPDPLWTANMDCSLGQQPVDLGDLTTLIAYLFLDGPVPCAGCPGGIQ